MSSAEFENVPGFAEVRQYCDLACPKQCGLFYDELEARIRSKTMAAIISSEMLGDDGTLGVITDIARDAGAADEEVEELVKETRQGAAFVLNELDEETKSIDENRRELAARCASPLVLQGVVDGHAYEVTVCTSEGAYNEETDHADVHLSRVDVRPSEEMWQTAPIREVIPGDGEASRELLREWIRHTPDGEPIEEEVDSVVKAIEDSASGLNDRQYAVMDINGTIVGIMGMVPPGEDMREFTTTENPVELINAFVDPMVRGLGTGKHLLKALEEKATAAGYTEFVVNSGPRYAASGWPFWTSVFGDAVAVRHELYGPGADAPVWTKRLAE